MIEEMQLQNFSSATQESCLDAVTRLTKHYRRSPDQFDKEQIRSYLLYLTVERKLSPNTMMGQIAGLRFFYNQTLGWVRDDPAHVDATRLSRNHRADKAL